MNFRRFQFNIVSIIEVIVIIAFVPLTIGIWKKSIHNMSYSIHFKDALAYYSSQKNAEMDQSLNQAEMAHPEDPMLERFRANAMTEVRREKKSKPLYENQISQGYTDSTLPYLGLAICKLYEIDALSDRQEQSSQWIKLEKEIKSTIKENKNYADLYILLGHICLKKSRYAQESKDKKKVKVYWDEAAAQFNLVDQKTKENAELFQKMDLDFDNKISSKEWKGTKEAWEEADKTRDAFLDRAEALDLWTPPSRFGVYSFYLGKAMLFYAQGMQLWEELPPLEPPLTQVQAMAEHMEAALLAFRQAYTTRILNKDLPIAIATLYKQLLTYPWLPVDSRKRIIEDCKMYVADMEQFATHLRNIGQANKVEEAQILYGKTDLTYARGVAYYYLGQHTQAFDDLSYGCTPSPSLDPFLSPHARVQNAIAIAEKEVKLKKEFYPYLQSPILQKYYSEGVLALPQNKPLSVREFLILNNYLGCLYFQAKVEKNPAHASAGLKVAEKYIRYLPDHSFYLTAGQKATSRQILWHNLYKLSQETDPEKAKSWKKHRIVIQEKKEEDKK